MTRQVHDNGMVAHLWANQAQESARSHNGNLYFEGDMIYSYGSHFPIARHVATPTGHAVLFTTRGYSITTTGHKSRVRRAIPEGDPVFHVDNVTAASGAEHVENFAEYRQRFAAYLQSARRSRTEAARGWRLDNARKTAEEANRYAETFGLTERLYWTDDHARDLEAVQADLREIAQQQRDKAREAAVEAVAAWRRDGVYRPALYAAPVALRLDGANVQTSHGARVPVEEAKRLFGLIQLQRNAGRAYVPSRPILVGDFRLNEIEANGNVRIGCHFIEWPEIERLARQLDLIPQEEKETA